MSATVGASTGRKDREYAVSVFAGCFAGLCSTCVTNPLDTIRVRLAASRSATGRSHRSLVYTVKDLFGEGVVHAFSRGLGANMMASLPSNGIYLPSYRFLQQELEVLGFDERVRPVVSALGAVCATNLTLAPLFLVRTRVQVDDRLTIRQVFRDVLHRDGVGGFYRGTLTNIGGRFVEEALFWSIYELLKRLTNEGSFHDKGSFFMASAAMLSLTMFSKLAAATLAYPYNVVMTHLRTVNHVTGKHEHTQFIQTVRHVYRDDGITGFYKGLSPQLLRSVISKATQIYAFEVAMYAYYCVSTRTSPTLTSVTAAAVSETE
ncbi:putative mitochondrial carrier protein [Trypanosoma grayi]|uniref:putative mitochondrial carrier protein n=1 Tax=Trypanosoma grayi TaxID=71804 RepID=UPI0004F4961A|nr:putative mitochondrial carrier protein [Trypanosoma grayi]KEG13926.1 putative mitochondrial carrier protein [Trypanosoma grayi]